MTPRSTRPRQARPRRESSRWFPLLGVLAALCGLGAVYVSFVANSGVPAVPTYDLTVDVADANRMIQNNQVRVGGVRIGQVASVEAVPPASDDPRGRPTARLGLKLESGADRIPTDSRVRIRPASVLGATYLEITPGKSRRTVPDGGHLARGRSAETVELTDLLDMFDAGTARRIQATVTDVGAGLAGRGTDLGETVTNLATVSPPLTRLLRMLGAPETGLRELVVGYEAALSAMGRQHTALDGLITDGARTFTALAAERDALAATFEVLPGAARATTRTFTTLRPALRDLADIAVRLRPAARLLPAGLTAVSDTVEVGTPGVRMFPRLTRPLERTLTELERTTAAPATEGALRKTGEAMGATQEILEVFTPAQVHCNVLSLWGQNLYKTFGTMGTGRGATYGPLTLTQLGTNFIELLQNREPHKDLHVNYLPRVDDQECESNNEPFTDGHRSLANPPGLQSKDTVPTVPPPGVIGRARRAGLLDTPPGG